MAIRESKREREAREARERQRKRELDERFRARPRGSVGVYDFGLPSVPQHLPPGVRVVDCGGHYAVALCANGAYLGLYRRAA